MECGVNIQVVICQRAEVAIDTESFRSCDEMQHQVL